MLAALIVGLLAPPLPSPRLRDYTGPGDAPGPAGVAPVQAPAVRVVVTGGMAGWDITSIALGAALRAAAAAVLLYLGPGRPQGSCLRSPRLTHALYVDANKKRHEYLEGRKPWPLCDRCEKLAAKYLRPGETVQAAFGAHTASQLVAEVSGVPKLLALNRYRIVVITPQRVLILDAGGNSMTTARGVVAELPRSTRLGPPSGLWHVIPAAC